MALPGFTILRLHFKFWRSKFLCIPIHMKILFHQQFFFTYWSQIEHIVSLRNLYTLDCLLFQIQANSDLVPDTSQFWSCSRHKPILILFQTLANSDLGVNNKRKIVEYSVITYKIWNETLWRTADLSIAPNFTLIKKNLLN